MPELPLRQLDQVVVGHGPHAVALEHEVLESEAGAAVLDHVRRPLAEVLDAADLARRGSGCRSSCRGSRPSRGRPARRSGSRGSASPSAAARTSGGGGGSRTLTSVAKGIDEMTSSAGILGLAARFVARDHRGGARTRHGGSRSPVCSNSHGRPLARHELRAALPHHPGAVLRVLELLDEAGDLLGPVLRASRTAGRGSAPTRRGTATCP